MSGRVLFLCKLSGYAETDLPGNDEMWQVSDSSASETVLS